MVMIKNSFKRAAPEFPLESRILIITALVGILFSFAAAIGNYFLDAGMIPTLASALMGVLTLCFFYLAYVKKQYKVPAYGAMLVLTLLFIPLLWFYNGGLSGSIPFFFLFNIVLSAALLNKLRYPLVLGVQIVVGIAMLCVEFYSPASIVHYDSATALFLDKAASLVVVSLVMFLMIMRIMQEYHRTIDKLKLAQEELKNSNAVLYQASITDDLTGLYNRRHIIELLSGFVERGGRESGICVVMLDVDNFKAVNDTYGHTAGDLVLAKLGAAIREHFRNTDFIGRIGGEEFLILMPDTKLETALARAETIRKYIEGLSWHYPRLRVTVSGGIYAFSGPKAAISR